MVMPNAAPSILCSDARGNSSLVHLDLSAQKFDAHTATESAAEYSTVLSSCLCPSCVAEVTNTLFAQTVACSEFLTHSWSPVGAMHGRWRP